MRSYKVPIVLKTKLEKIPHAKSAERPWAKNQDLSLWHRWQAWRLPKKFNDIDSRARVSDLTAKAFYGFEHDKILTKDEIMAKYKVYKKGIKKQLQSYLEEIQQKAQILLSMTKQAKDVLLETLPPENTQ